MSVTEHPRLALSLTEFCKQIGVGRSKAYTEIHAGRLRAKKLGSNTIITAEDARAYLDSLPDARDNLLPVAANFGKSPK